MLATLPIDDNRPTDRRPSSLATGRNGSNPEARANRLRLNGVCAAALSLLDYYGQGL
jgi:hypothetical protein